MTRFTRFALALTAALSIILSWLFTPSDLPEGSSAGSLSSP